MTWQDDLAELDGKDPMDGDASLAVNEHSRRHNLVKSALAGLAAELAEGGGDGADGREVELQVSATHIQWRYVGDASWQDLIALSELEGEDGQDGQDGAPGDTHVPDPSSEPDDRMLEVQSGQLVYTDPPSGGGLPDTAAITIVELTEGVWSADLPARDPGVNPAVLVGMSDPADGTNGIGTPANINSRDRWVELDSL